MKKIDLYLKNENFLTIVHLAHEYSFAQSQYDPMGFNTEEYCDLASGIHCFEGRLALDGDNTLRPKAPRRLLYACNSVIEYSKVFGTWRVIKSRYIDPDVLKESLMYESPLVQMMHPDPVVRHVGQVRLKEVRDVEQSSSQKVFSNSNLRR